VLRAAGGTETAQGNAQDWLQLDEGDPGFQLLLEEGIASVVILFHLFSAELPILLHSAFIYFRLLGQSFAPLFRINIQSR
jgi:hypothetical protein